MLHPGLHPSRWDRPDSLRLVDLRPSGAACLARARSREDQPFKCELRCGIGRRSAQQLDEVWHLWVWQRTVVLDLTVARSELLRDADAGRCPLPLATENGAFEDSLHSLEDPLGSLGFCVPDRLQHLEHIGMSHIADRATADLWKDVRLHSGWPLREVLGIGQPLPLQLKERLECLPEGCGSRRLL